MTEPLAKPRRKNPFIKTRAPTTPPHARSRAAHGLTRAAAEGRFALQRCAECGTYLYPAHDACPVCLGADLPVVAAPDGGTLVSETTVRIPGDVYFRERAPWRIGIVALACGPTVVAHLHGDCREEAPVRMVLKLDRAGQAVAFALPAERTPDMADDPQLREMTADPKHRRVLVTDGRSPFGQAVVSGLAAAGAATIFVGIADPARPWADEAKLRGLAGVEVVPLDVTDTTAVGELAASIGGKVDILVNTVDAARPGSVADPSNIVHARQQMDLCYFGLLRLAQAFGPAMRGRGADGAVTSAVAWVNCLSVTGLAAWPGFGSYSAAQAAAVSASHALRAELRPGGIRVINLFTGPTETEWFSTLPPPKVSPAVLARAVVRALQDGTEDVFVGDVAEDIRARLAENPKAVERELGAA